MKKQLKNSTTGTLYLVATPIGNLRDITFRAVDTLKEVGMIAAEDTRHSLKLMRHYGISTRLISYHDHNKERSAPGIVKQLLEGVDVALVTDAGSPGISDPGYYLVNLAHENGISVTACPGACAAIMALSISGLPTDKFAFFGFLPTRPGKRKKILKSLANENKSVVFYETSKRLEKLLAELYENLGDRNIVITRELTKVFEETIRGRLSDLLRDAVFSDIKGELVIVVAKGDKTPDSLSSDFERRPPLERDEVKEAITALLRDGVPVKTVSRQISDKYDISKNEVYNFCIKHSV